MPIIHSKSPQATQPTGMVKSVKKDRKHHSSQIEELGSAYEQSVSSGAKNNHPVVTLSRMKSEQ